MVSDFPGVNMSSNSTQFGETEKLLDFTIYILCYGYMISLILDHFVLSIRIKFEYRI